MTLTRPDQEKDAVAESEREDPPQAEADDTDYNNGQGETPDTGTQAALRLAHSAVRKFPELTRRYQVFVGTAAVLSSAVVVLASIAVSRRLHRGQSPDRILEEITTDEIESIAREKPAKPPKPAKRSRFLP
jgi:hypothetical protein